MPSRYYYLINACGNLTQAIEELRLAADTLEKMELYGLGEATAILKENIGAILAELKRVRNDEAIGG